MEWKNHARHTPAGAARDGRAARSPRLTRFATDAPSFDPCVRERNGAMLLNAGALVRCKTIKTADFYKLTSHAMHILCRHPPGRVLQHTHTLNPLCARGGVHCQLRHHAEGALVGHLNGMHSDLA